MVKSGLRCRVSEHFETWYVLFLYLPYVIIDRTSEDFENVRALGMKTKHVLNACE